MASRVGYFGFSDVVQPIMDTAAKRLRQRRVYRQTVSELQALSARELSDLGIGRSAIHAVAKEAADQVL
jgi:uncharacterized protein YjiS (DUF1127 family)